MAEAVASGARRVRTAARMRWAGLYLLLLGAGACGALHGQENASTCQTGSDGDGDGQIGCADPDCHRYEVCRFVASPLLPDAGPSGGSDGTSGGSGGTQAGSGGASGAGAGGSGGGGGAMDAAVSDASEPRDSGPRDDASCDACPDSSSAPTDRYLLTVLEAKAPKGFPGPPPDGLCVEPVCAGGGGSPVGWCPCEPDPYVRVLHLAAGDPEMSTVVLETAHRSDTMHVTDFDESVEITLLGGDTLLFQVWDHNAINDHLFLYDCAPELSAIETGTLTCSVKSGALRTEDFHVTARIEPLPQ